MIVGLYNPGDSLLHRAGAGTKLIFLLAAGVGLVFIDPTEVLVAVAFGIGFLFVYIAELGLARLWTTTRPLLIWLVFIVLAHLLISDGRAAVSIALRLTALVWLAALVTYTTRLSDMTAALVKVCQIFQPFGVSPSRIAFVIALTIRLIPAIGDVVKDVREAQKARGLERSLVTAAVPVLIRIFRDADALSEALIARGYDSWDKAA